MCRQVPRKRGNRAIQGSFVKSIQMEDRSFSFKLVSMIEFRAN